MIVGCYSLHLYCDYCNRNSRTGKTVPTEFTGEFGADCRRSAKSEGWKLDIKNDKATCPECSTKKP